MAAFLTVKEFISVLFSMNCSFIIMASLVNLKEDIIVISISNNETHYI